MFDFILTAECGLHRSCVFELIPGDHKRYER